MVLEMAARMQLRAVLSLVAYRRSDFRQLPLQCPWHALLARRDQVFPSWAARTTSQAHAVSHVDDDHFLASSHEEVLAFLRSAIAPYVS